MEKVGAEHYGLTNTGDILTLFKSCINHKSIAAYYTEKLKLLPWESVTARELGCSIPELDIFAEEHGFIPVWKPIVCKITGVNYAPAIALPGSPCKQRKPITNYSHVEAFGHLENAWFDETEAADYLEITREELQKLGFENTSSIANGTYYNLRMLREYKRSRNI